MDKDLQALYHQAHNFLSNCDNFTLTQDENYLDFAWNNMGNIRRVMDNKNEVLAACAKNIYTPANLHYDYIKHNLLNKAAEKRKEILKGTGTIQVLLHKAS